MAQTKNINRRTSYTNERSRDNRNMYNYENTARKYDVQRQLQESPKKQASHAVRKNREKAYHMNVGYVLFLIGAMVFSTMILINYLQIQADTTNTSKYIAKQEQILSNMQQENDETYNRIISNINLEEIRRIAIEELGMVYPEEGQIITFTDESYDYVRKAS